MTLTCNLATLITGTLVHSGCVHRCQVYFMLDLTRKAKDQAAQMSTGEVLSFLLKPDSHYHCVIYVEETGNYLEFITHAMIIIPR